MNPYAKCNNSIIWLFWDGIIPLRAAKPQVKELKIPYESGEVHLYFPMNGIAGVVNNNSTMRGEASNGGIIFHHNCYAMNGEIEMYLD